MRRFIMTCAVCALSLSLASNLVPAAEAAELAFSRAQLTMKWRVRIQTLLDQGKLALIDMESSLQQQQVAEYIPEALKTFDDLGIAMMSADGYQDPKDGRKGYRWSRYVQGLVNDHPSHFIPTANGGTNPNWFKQKGGKATDYIDQMEAEIRTGRYFSMGELEFRHYMSSSQCKQGRVDRNVDIALDGENGHRVFALSADTGVAFVIHLEPEPQALAALEEMLGAYPGARVIVAHFGQVRHPEVQDGFTPDLVRRLLATYANLYYDLATGHPNRPYKCAGADNALVLRGDTVLWSGAPGHQSDVLQPAYQAILTDFSDRFVFATDYGGGRRPLPQFLKGKHENFMRIIRDLPKDAQHNIAYRNAWKLLTGKAWGAGEG